MHTTASNPVARLLAPVGKLTLALFGAAAIGTAFAGDVAWKGTAGTFSNGANWSTEAYPTSSDTAQFMGASAGSTVTFDGTYAVGYIWVGEATNPALYIDDNGTATPVVFTASDPSYGMTTAGRFCCADGANQRGALTVNSGTYTTTAGGYWGWGDNVKFVANFNGGTVNINGSPDGSSNGLYMMYGNGVANEINIAGGKLAVENDVVIGTGADATSSTTINISNGGELSCGTASTAKWFKMPADGTGRVTVNLNANGTLALWHIRHVSAGECAVNFNGGTLKVLGDIGYGLLGYDNNTDASTMSFTLGANGGTIDTDFNTSLNNPVSGTGGLTKKGSGTLTFSAMPTFTGAITVEAGAGSVILPSGATVAAGTDTRTRTTSAGVEYYYFSGSTYTSSTLFTAGDDATITLSGDAVLDVDDTKTIGKLTVTGSGVLSIAGSGAVTASSLQIDSGATVQLASGTTLADGRIVTTSVTGAGVIGYTGVNPDSSVGYDNSAAWTGTVWIQGLTGLVNWNPTAFGNSASTLRLSGVAGYFVNAQLSLPFAIELENDIYSYGIDLTNGYSFNSTGGWCYVKVPTLKGSGTYKTSGGGGNLFVVTDDWSGFTGSFNLANKTVWLGYGTPAAEVDFTPGTVAGGIRIAEGRSVNWSTSWTLSKFFGEGTIKMAAPWDATPAFAGYVGDSTLWTGTVELAACVNDGTGSVGVYPDRMGNANSKIVFKGLAPGATKGYYFNGSTSAMVQLDGDVTISDGSSNATYSLGILTGTGSFTGATSLGNACTFAFSAVSNYTGTISANSKSLVTIGTYMSDADVAVGTKLVSVDSDNAYVTLKSVAVAGGEPQTVATAAQSGDDGYGVYVTAVQRDVYWVGGASGNWSDTTAWALADGTPLGSYPQDFTQYAGDNVIFTNVASVAVDAKVVVTKITLDADVTFSCASLNGSVGLWFETMDGEGKLRMSNIYIAIISSGSRHVTIMNDVEVVDGSSNAMQTGKSGLSHIYGDVTGSGTLTLWTNGNNGGLAFHGDNSGFYGTFDTSASGSTRNDTSLFYGNASSANAIWKVRANSYSVQTVSLIRDSGTYYFGALQGYVNVGDYAPTIVVGDRSDEDSSFSITSRKSTKVVKTGSGLATHSRSDATGNGTFNTFYSHDIYGGTLVLEGVAPTDHISFLGVGATLKTPSYTSGDSTVYPDVSGLIKNSTSAICFDDAGEDFTWTSALAASNAGGFTKKGVGTLTLTAVPQYSGQTVVEAGELVVPAGTMLESLSGAGTLIVDLTGASESGILFSLVNKAEGATVEVRNAPEGYQTLNTANGVIYYIGEPKTYVWAVSEGSGNWSDVSNWSVVGGTPTVPPTAIDTVQFNDGASVVIDAAATALTIEGNGALTITADYDLSVAADIEVSGVLTKWGMATVSAKGAISASTVAVGTGAMTTYSGDASTTLALDSGSTSAYAVDDAASALGYGAKYSVVSPGTLVLSGHGQIVASGDQIIDVATGADTNSFTGFMSGSMSLSKTGAGTLAIFGNNTFTGDFAIDEGTVKLNTPLDIQGIRYDFDSSDESWFSYDGNGVLRWQDAAHPENANAFSWNDSTNPTFVENNNSIFNGRKVLYSDSFRMVEPATGNSPGNPKTAFFVVQNTDGGHTNIAGDRNETRGNIRWRNNGFMAGFGSGGSTSWNSNGIWGNGTLATQGDNGGYNPGSDPTVLTFVNDCADIYKCWFDVRSTRQMYFGGSGKQAWAEYLSYTRELSFDEKAAVEQYLMAKWGINNMEYTVLPKTANLTMAASAKLEMGGLTQTVASFAGAGTIANGYLKTTGDFTATGSLTVQAAEGQTYTLSQNQSDNLKFTGDATGYFVKVPDNASTVSRVIVPHGVTVGYDFAGTAFDVTIVNAPTKWAIRVAAGEEWDTYTIGYRPFFVILR